MGSERTETVFTWGATPIKFGTGALDEIGFDLSRLGVRRILIITDPGVAATGIPERVRAAATAVGIRSTVYDQVHIEPTDESFRAAIAFAGGTEWDGFVAVGGGSAIDTAKIVNLLTTHPGEILDYVNKPIGAGRTPPGPLKPLIAVPTTAGTGSESTATCVLDLLELKVKSGISHPYLRPTFAIVDPLVTVTMPPAVTAASGMDVLCHALESYTAKPFTAFPRKQPEERVPYCGSNPISDNWAEQTFRLIARSFRKAVHSGDDLDARQNMMLAATFAGMGFGNAGVHLPHANAYPIAGRVTDYRPAGYPGDEPLVPHGESVSLTAPAAFRFTFATDSRKHLRAADLLSPSQPARRRLTQREPADRLPAVLTELMRDIGIPNGIGGVGYTADDIPDLVAGSLQQHRLLAVAPRPVGADELTRIFTDSITNW